MVQIQEEVVDYYELDNFENSVINLVDDDDYYQQVLVFLVIFASSSVYSYRKKRRSRGKKFGYKKSYISSEVRAGSGSVFEIGRKKWEQKQVYIKILEGEFFVIMWCSSSERDNEIEGQTEENLFFDYLEYVIGKKFFFEGIFGVDFLNFK